MRKFAFLAPLAAVMAVAAAAHAEPASITVTLGPDVLDRVEEFGAREVQDQADRLSELVSRAIAGSDALDGARIELVLADIKPNRLTHQQMIDRPAIDPILSVSIGGATIEGQITTADGRVQPVRYDWYSNNLSEARGYATWQDAERAYRRLGSNLAAGRYVTN